MNKREKSFRKRGLSTIVTTLISILLVLVAVGIVWVVVKNVISGGLEDVSLGKIMINFDVKGVKIYDNNISVIVKRNIGEGEITGLKFIVFDGVESQVFEEKTTINELEEKTFVLNYDGLVKSISVASISKTDSGKESIGSRVAEKEFSNYDVIKNIPGLISWWRFEGNANDEFGGYHGVINGADCSINGKYGKACLFDGVDDYINISNSNSLNFVSGGLHY